MVWRHAVTVTGGDKSLADDIASETMMTLASHVASVDLKNGGLANWITGVVRHKASDVYRRAHRGLRAAEAAATRTACDHSKTDVSLSLEVQETRNHVFTTLEKMSSDERLALEWK